MDPLAVPAWADGNRDLTLRYKVHLGVWTDWSRGPVLGPTLTLDRQQANLLIAFTASFVVIIGSRFWRIICFFLHQAYSTSGPRDALHHQRQVLLRNSEASDSGVFKFIALLYAWRRLNFKSILRLAPALLLATVCTIGFAVAGGFSSQIQIGSAIAGSDVLLDGADCRILGTVTSTIEQLSLKKLEASSIDTANNYVQQCYSANSAGLTDCNYVVSQRLPGFVDNAAPCPFDDAICRSNSTNLSLDTGFINTDAHLGLNAPPEERLFIRHKLQCAPLLTEGRSIEYENYTRYNYGPYYGIANPETLELGYLNYTYEVESLENQYTVKDDGNVNEQSYLIRNVYAGTINGTPGADAGSRFLPIAELERTDADIFIVFLSGHGVFFSEPLHDDWYRATQDSGRTMHFAETENIPIYTTSEAASPLACASQWQYCNTNTSTCGPMASSSDAFSGAMQAFGVGEDGSSETRPPAADRLEWLMGSASIPGYGEDVILSSLQDSALLSKQSLNTGFQAPLPDNQWQLDVTNWFSIYLAYIQSSLLQTASGLQAAGPEIHTTKPTTQAASSLCSNQKIRTTRYSSFSFFGILFTYILGCLILVLSYSLEPILACLHRRRRYRQYAYLEWMTNETLQLHRLANEGPNEVDPTWSKCTSLVPTTAPGVVLSNINISDLKHPRLSSKHLNEVMSNSSGGDTTPEALESGFPSPKLFCDSTKQSQMTYNITTVDAESPRICIPEMIGMGWNPNEEHQVAQISIPPYGIEPRSPLEHIPVQESTSRSRPQTRPG